MRGGGEVVFMRAGREGSAHPTPYSNDPRGAKTKLGQSAKTNRVFSDYNSYYRITMFNFFSKRKKRKKTLQKSFQIWVQSQCVAQSDLN